MAVVFWGPNPVPRITPGSQLMRWLARQSFVIRGHPSPETVFDVTVISNYRPHHAEYCFSSAKLRGAAGGKMTCGEKQMVLLSSCHLFPP